MEAKGRRLPRIQRDRAAALSERPKEVDMALMEQDISRCHEEIAALREEMRNGFKDIRSDMSDLIQAWKAAGMVGKFVKWLAGLVTAAGVLWAVTKGMVGKP